MSKHESHATRRILVAAVVLSATLVLLITCYSSPLSRSNAAEFSEAGTGVTVEVTPQPTILAQPSSNTSWAATLTMMVNWKNSTSLSIGEVVSPMPGRWRELLDNNSSLPDNDATLDDLSRRNGLQVERAADCSPRRCVDLLIKYGPLWVLSSAQPTDGDQRSLLIVGAVITSEQRVFLKFIDSEKRRMALLPGADVLGESRSKAGRSDDEKELPIRIVRFRN